MSGKNFRVVQTGQRTSVEGKQVSNKVLLATPDNEYELMRPDLTYIDLPHHLSLHEPTQNIEFVYFPNRGMVSQVVVTKDGRTVEVGVVGNEGYVGAGLYVRNPSSAWTGGPIAIAARRRRAGLAPATPCPGVNSFFSSSYASHFIRKYCPSSLSISSPTT